MSDKAREKFDALLAQVGLSVAEGFYVGNGYGDGHVCVYREGLDGYQHHLHAQWDDDEYKLYLMVYPHGGDKHSYAGYDIMKALPTFDYLDCPVAPTTKWQLEPERHDPFWKAEREARVAEWFASHPEASSVDLIEFRPPNVDDVLEDLFRSLLQSMEHELKHGCDTLWDTAGWNGPTIADADPAKPSYAALRTALSAYLQDHLDLSESCWQPTGRQARWYVDGRVDRIAP